MGSRALGGGALGSRALGAVGEECIEGRMLEGVEHWGRVLGGGALGGLSIGSSRNWERWSIGMGRALGWGEHWNNGRGAALGALCC